MCLEKTHLLCVNMIFDGHYCVDMVVMYCITVCTW